MSYDPEEPRGLWIVWSNEHRSFWAANRQGYAQRIENAGRYSREEAETICRGANYRANSTINVGTPPEICMPAPEALEALTTDLAEAKARVGELASAVKNILPIGDASMPDKAVFPIYVRMSELRALHRLVAGAQSWRN